MIPESAAQNFKNVLRGPLLVPAETAYETARMVPNSMIDRRPCLIARCAGAGDVMECVRFARDMNWSCQCAAEGTAWRGRRSATAA